MTLDVYEWDNGPWLYSVEISSMKHASSRIQNIMNKIERMKQSGSIVCDKISLLS